MSTIPLMPIGIIHSPHRVTTQTPRHSESARGIAATVEIAPEFNDGLKDLDGFSYLWLLVYLHAARELRLQTPTARGEPLHGIFATRLAHRPNPIGLSVVRLVRIDGNVLHIEDIDFLDGTPVLDIKPYVPALDQRAGASSGWYGRHLR